MTATLLPIPDDPRFQRVIDAWNDGAYEQFQYPRSVWLHYFEDLLRSAYPSANAKSLRLTARHAAPFYLRDGHDVP